MIGKKLPNGATILAYHIGPTRDGVVLAYVRPGERATWDFYRDDLSTTSHGHYFSDANEAFADYIDRVASAMGRTIITGTEVGV